MGQAGSVLTNEEVEEMRLVSNFSEAELRRLHRRFRKLDKDGTGNIKTVEFAVIPELRMNPLLERILEIFDEDKDEHISFKEFITALSVFSSKTSKEAKLRFAFQVYDIDGDGVISNGELFQVLKMMCGSNLTDEQLQQVVDKTIMEADLDKDGAIAFEEFSKVVAGTDIVDQMTIKF